MTIKQWTSFQSSSSSRSDVAPGTPCAPCTAKGHFCQAREIVGGRCVCIYCLDGVDCPRVPRNGAMVAPRPRPPMVSVTMPPEEREEQRRSFAQGNVSMSNPDVTREVIDAAADSLPAAQPSLAPGATASKAMPARRKFLKAAVSSPWCCVCKQAQHAGPCMCTRCGGLRHRGSCPRRAKASQLSEAAAQEVIAEASEIAARVNDEVQARAEAMERATEQGETKLATTSEGKLAVKSDVVVPAADYEVVDMSKVPGRPPQISPYADAIEKLKLLPVGKALMRSFPDKTTARIHREGICRRARVTKLAVNSKMDGLTIYVWRKA